MLDLKRREFIALVGAGGLLLAVKVKRAWGQQPAMPVIGFLITASPSQFADRIAAFREGLRKEEFVQDRNVAFEFRWLEGQGYDRMQQLAAELVAHRVDVIVAGGGAAAPAKAATSTIPIIGLSGGDPVRPASSPASTGRTQTSLAWSCSHSPWGPSDSSCCASQFRARSSSPFLPIHLIQILKQRQIRKGSRLPPMRSGSKY